MNVKQGKIRWERMCALGIPPMPGIVAYSRAFPEFKARYVSQCYRHPSGDLRAHWVVEELELERKYPNNRWVPVVEYYVTLEEAEEIFHSTMRERLPIDALWPDFLMGGENDLLSFEAMKAMRCV